MKSEPFLDIDNINKNIIEDLYHIIPEYIPDQNSIFYYYPIDNKVSFKSHFLGNVEVIRNFAFYLIKQE